MRIETALKRGLDRVGRLWEEGRYELALDDVRRLLELSPANPRLLVMRAQLTQLQDTEEEPPTLADAKADLKLASQLDEVSPAPLIELAYFTYAIDDDARGASRLFRGAIARCRELLREALLGQAKALTELGREGEALACLAEAQGLGRRDAKGDDAELLDQFRAILQAN